MESDQHDRELIRERLKLELIQIFDELDTENQRRMLLKLKDLIKGTSQQRIASSTLQASRCPQQNSVDRETLP